MRTSTHARPGVAALALAAALAVACSPGAPAPTSSPEPSASPSAIPTSTRSSASPQTTPAPVPTTTPPRTDLPAPALPAPLTGRIVTALPTDRRVVALTFDGGASDTGVAPILSALSAAGVRATFFPTGDFARRYPAAVASFAAAGHRVGNHSDTHRDFTALSTSQQVAELKAAQDTISALTGSTTLPWFRFPFGASDDSAIATVNGQGYACIGWTVDTLGWKGTGDGQSADSVVQRVVSTSRPGQIVLMHVGANPQDGSTLDADALPRIIDELRALGYDFVTLDAALG